MVNTIVRRNNGRTMRIVSGDLWLERLSIPNRGQSEDCRKLEVKSLLGLYYWSDISSS